MEVRYLAEMSYCCFVGGLRGTRWSQRQLFMYILAMRFPSTITKSFLTLRWASQKSLHGWARGVVMTSLGFHYFLLDFSVCGMVSNESFLRILHNAETFFEKS